MNNIKKNNLLEMKNLVSIILLSSFVLVKSQTTDFDRGLQVGSIPIQGLAALKGSKKSKRTQRQNHTKLVFEK